MRTTRRGQRGGGPLRPLVVVMLASLVVTSGRAQEGPCDPQLEPHATDPHQYQLRDDRCEGIYVQNVSSIAVRVASLTAEFVDFSASGDAPLVIEWGAPDLLPSPTVHLRAQSVAPRLYYRMDTVQPAEMARYQWPTDILNALAIRREDVGILGWTQARVAGEDRVVYLPLRINQGEGGASHFYTLGIVPDAELEEVFVTLATLGTDGEPESYLINGDSLGYGYYPAGRLVPIPISHADLESPGIYYLEIGALLSSGGSSVIELWFLHGGGGS